MNKQRKAFFFFELHALNLPLAIFLRMFGRVIVYQHKGWCSRFLTSDFFEKISDFKDTDQWLETDAEAYSRVKPTHQKVHSLAPRIRINRQDLDSEAHFLQKFAISYTRYLFFLTLVSNYKAPLAVIGFNFRSFLLAEFPNLLHSQDKNFQIIPYSFIDRLYEAWTARIGVVRIIRWLTSSTKHSTQNLKPFSYICSGVGAPAYPSEENKLDFTWIVSNQVLQPQETFYILDAPPNSAQSTYLKSKNINFSTTRDLVRGLPLAAKLTLGLKLVTQFFTSPVKNSYVSNSEAEFTIEAEIWYSLLSRFNAKKFIFSFSFGWPDSLSCIACRSLGLSTAMWFYSSGEFRYANKIKNFNDDCLRFCNFAADEVWVWNEAIKDLFAQRVFSATDIEKIKTPGPMLNGNWDCLKTPRIPGEYVQIAFFDISPMKSKYRLDVGEGPFCNSDLTEDFYQMILELHGLVPNSRILIKGKRKPDPERFDDIPAMNKLSQGFFERIEWLAADTNPYQVVADADFVVSVPFTSPTMLALSLGKPAVYFLPKKYGASTFRNYFSETLVTSTNELIEKIQSSKSATDIASKECLSRFTPATPSSIEENLNKLLIT